MLVGSLGFLLTECVTFLCPHKKVTKESGLRGASSKCAPLRNPRRFSDSTWKIAQFSYAILRNSHTYDDAPREGYIGEGVLGARERVISASPMSASFGTFLAGTRKVHEQTWVDRISLS